jgi:hypothetical protein
MPLPQILNQSRCAILWERHLAATNKTVLLCQPTLGEPTSLSPEKAKSQGSLAAYTTAGLILRLSGI